MDESQSTLDDSVDGESGAAPDTSDTGDSLEIDPKAEDDDEPSPPSTLPNYVTDPISRQGIDALREVIDYAEARREFLKRNPDESDLPGDGETNVDADGNWEYITEETTTCGDSNCKCGHGDGAYQHGPYKKRYYKKDDGTLTSEWIPGSGDTDE